MDDFNGKHTGVEIDTAIYSMGIASEFEIRGPQDSSYFKNDFVTKDEKLWILTVDEFKGEWDQSKWEQTTINTVCSHNATSIAKMGNLNDLATSEKRTLVGAINEVNEIIPTVAGTPGQVLALNQNNTPSWKTIVISEEEYVTVQLAVASGSGSVADVSVNVSIEGGSTTTYKTDSSGICHFSIASGAIYNISCGDIFGYKTPDIVSVRSALAVRTVNITYVPQTNLEHVSVTCWYDSQLSMHDRATQLTVICNGTTLTYQLVNDKCSFDIPMGTAYTIQCQSVTSFVTPANITLTASQETRGITIYYVRSVNQLAWVKTDGTLVDFNNLSSLQESEVFGVRIQTSALAETPLRGSCAYVIPWAYLIGSSTVGQKQWCTQNVQFNYIGMYNTESAALTDTIYNGASNFDGQANTLAVLTEASERSLSVPAFDTVNRLTYTIGGVTRHGFIGSYAQMKAFGTNRNDINNIVSNAFGKNVININSGSWWTSTQHSVTNAVYLGYGGFDNYLKYNYFQVVPFLAY